MVGGSRVTGGGFGGVKVGCDDGALGEVVGLWKYVTVGFYRKVIKGDGGVWRGVGELVVVSRGGRKVRDGSGGGGGPRLPRRGQYHMYRAQVFQLGGGRRFFPSLRKVGP